MRGRKGNPGRLLRPEGLKVIPGPQASDEDIQASKLFWKCLDVGKKQAAMRFGDSRLVDKVVEVQKALQRSDMQCYMLGIRGQDAVREKTGMNNFAMISDDESRKMMFIARAEFAERSDLFEYMAAALGTPFLKGRPVLAPEKWHMLFDKAPSSWPEFLRQVLALAEQAILSAYQSSADASKNKPREPLETTTATAGRAPEVTDEQIIAMLQETPTVSKCAKRKARVKKRQAMLKRNDDEDESTFGESVAESATAVLERNDDEDESTIGESVAESATEASSIMLDSIKGSSGGARYPLQSTTASAGIDDDRVSVSTMDTALLHRTASSGIRPAEDDELHVDWSSANPIGPAAPLQTVQESVELEVDWNDDQTQPEETRWSASMVDVFTGVQANWHWIANPRPMLTCGNLRAHIKNTFFEGVYDTDEFPEELARAKSAPAPRRRRWSP